MPIPDSIVEVPFNQGPDQRQDNKLSAKPDQLENYIFSGGRLKKRPGSSAYSSNIVGGGTLAAGEGLAVLDGELLRLQGGALHSWAPAAGKWQSRGNTPPLAKLTRDRLIRNNRNQQHADWATANNVTVIAWEEQASSSAAPGIHIAVRDNTTGAFYQTGAAAVASLGGSGASYPKCVAVGNSVHVYFRGQVSTQLCLGLIDTLNPQTAPVLSTLRTDLDATVTNVLDAVVSASTAIVLYTSTGTSGELTLMQVSSAGVVSGSPAPTAITAHATSFIGASISLLRDSNNALYVVVSEPSGTAVTWYAVHNGATFAQTKAKATIHNSSSPGVAALFEVSTGNVQLVQSVGASLSGTSGIGTAVLQAAAISVAFAVNTSIAGVFPVSAPFAFQGRTCFAAVLPSIFNSIHWSDAPFVFVLDTSFNVVARALAGSADLGSSTTTQRMPAPIVSGTSLRLLFSERGRASYNSSSGVLVDQTPDGITAITLTPSLANDLPAVRVGEGLHIGGAVPQLYDGQTVAEEGFNVAPTITATTPAGSLTGTYFYQVVFSWVDAKGQLHRSIPSAALRLVLSAQNATLTITTLGLTGKQNVQIEVYRTEANGTLFQRASSIAVSYFGATSTVTYTDSLSDAALESGEVIYTTNGVLDALPPPSFNIACAWQDRLVISGLEDPYEVRFSTQVVSGEGLRFNSVLRVRVPSETGKVTGLGVLDDKLVVLTEQTAYSTYGSGPDRLGRGEFAPLQQITSVSVGCTEPRSVIACPLGLIFKTADGFRLLTHQLEIDTSFGDGVASYNAWTVTSATAIAAADSTQVRFQADTGTGTPGVALVYFIKEAQWSVFTGYAGKDAVMFGGVYTRVQEGGTVLREDTTVNTDNAVQFFGVIETQWIRVAGIQGFQRVRRLLVLGDLVSHTALTVEVAYDYSTTYNVLDLSAVDSATVGYSLGQPFQFRHHLRVQKCEAMRVRLTEKTLTSPYGGMSLSALALAVAAKRGHYRGLSPAKTV